MKLINIRDKVICFEKYDSIIIELMDYLMKEFVNTDSMMIIENIKFYVFSFYSVINLISDENKMKHLILYIKISHDENIINKSNEYLIKEEEKFNKTIFLILRLILLKIKKNLEIKLIEDIYKSEILDLVKNLQLILYLIKNLKNINEIDSDDEVEDDITYYIRSIYGKCEFKRIFKENVEQIFSIQLKEVISKIQIPNLNMSNILNFYCNFYENYNQLDKFNICEDYPIFKQIIHEKFLGIIDKILNEEIYKFKTGNSKLDVFIKQINELHLEYPELNIFLEERLQRLFNECIESEDYIYINNIVREFLKRDIKILLNNNLISLISIISHKFITNLFKMLEDYMNENILNYMRIENYENYNDQTVCSNTFYELVNHIYEFYKFDEIELIYNDADSDDISTLNNAILRIIIKNYKSYINEIEKEGLINKKFLYDLKLLDYNYNKDLSDLSDININDNTSRKFFNFFYECNYHIIDDLSFWNYSNNQFKDLFQYDKRLNNFMLSKKTKKDKLFNINSTKLLEYRIDENYLSLKQSNITNKNKNIPQISKEVKQNESVFDYKGYINFFGGKLKENISNITGYVNKMDNQK